MNKELDVLRKKQIATDQRIDKCIENIKRLNKIIDGKPTPTGKLLSINEVSKMAGLSEYIIREDIKAGVIDSTKRGSRIKVTSEEAEKYIQ
jgi:hypothetical protein|tara:strand:+ start:2357 stop:2629 length:273 start_codon:yes stop_codon:yes gene_type:complete